MSGTRNERFIARLQTKDTTTVLAELATLAAEGARNLRRARAAVYDATLTVNFLLEHRFNEVREAAASQGIAGRDWLDAWRASIMEPLAVGVDDWRALSLQIREGMSRSDYVDGGLAGWHVKQNKGQRGKVAKRPIVPEPTEGQSQESQLRTWREMALALKESDRAKDARIRELERQLATALRHIERLLANARKVEKDLAIA